MVDGSPIFNLPFVSNVFGRDANDYYEIRSNIPGGEVVTLLESQIPLKGTIAIKNLSYFGNLELTIKHLCIQDIVKIIPGDPANNTLILAFNDIGSITLRFISDSQYTFFWGQFGYKLYLQEDLSSTT